MAKGDASRAYVGRSGQLAVVAELLARQCNAAVPEVDVGTDVFAFQDESEEVARVQVKTARGVRYADGSGYSAQFSIPLSQLERSDKPSLFYTLVVRLDDEYVEFLVLSRARLRTHWDGKQRFGSKDTGGNLILKVQFRDRVICGKVDLTEYRKDWKILPPLKVKVDAVGSPQEQTGAGARLPRAELGGEAGNDGADQT